MGIIQNQLTLLHELESNQLSVSCHKAKKLTTSSNKEKECLSNGYVEAHTIKIISD